jgi:hypothetical protein
MGLWLMGIGYWVVSGRVRAGYLGLYIYIYYLIKYCRAGGYPPDQNSKNRYPLSGYLKYPYPYPSVYMRAGGQTGGSAGLVGRVGFHSFLPTPSCNGGMLDEM